MYNDSNNDPIRCSHCQGTSFVLSKRVFSNSTKHTEARCSACGSFLKYIGATQNKNDELILPFGKHKGQSLATILEKDKSYIEWLSVNIKGSIAIKALELLSKKGEQHGS